MDDGKDVSPLGKILENAGWRQCSVFRCGVAELPDYLSFDPAAEWLVVCTQSCSICSIKEGAEPTIEVAVATPVASTNPNDPIAKGHHVRHLEVAVDGLQGHPGLRIDIGRRAFLPREAFGTAQPTSVCFPDSSLKLFQGWMSRYYSRIALPGQLVKRMGVGKRKESVKGRIEDVLKQKLLDGGYHRSVYQDVHRIYIWCNSMEDLPGGQDYQLELLFACTNHDTKNYLLQELAGMASGVKGKRNDIGIIMSEPDAAHIDDLTVGQVKDMWRMTLWDDVSETDSSEDPL